MRMAIVPLSCYWFSLFSINKYAVKFIPDLKPYAMSQEKDGTPLLIKEEHVALLIFGVTLLWYLFWVFSTVT